MSIYQIKITLLNQKNPTYRTILFDSDVLFEELALDLQTCFSISGYESWMFIINDKLILTAIEGNLNEALNNDNVDILEADDFKLSDLLPTNQKNVVFSYIFENAEIDETTAFEFSIELETILPVSEALIYPFCIDAKGDHPDEDFLDLSKLSKKELMLHKASHLLDIDEINGWFHDENEFDVEFDDDFEDGSIQGFGFLDKPDDEKKGKDGGFSIPFSLN